VGKFSKNAQNSRFTATFAPFYARLKKSPTLLRYTPATQVVSAALGREPT
jgi:hypothetical protein